MTEISVILPTYKRDIDLLERSITSLFNQTIQKDIYEVIVVDDNYKESKFRKNNIALIEKYKENHPNFKINLILNETNLGGAVSRNKGVKYSKAEYITFLDDDDIYLENKLLNQLNFIRKHDYDLIFSNLIIKRDSRIIDFRNYDWIENFNNDNLLKMHLLYHITGTPSFMFKREKFLKVEGFPKVQMGQEFHLMLNSIQSNLVIGYLNSSDVIAYIHNGERISNGNNKINGENKLYNLKMQYKYLFSKNEIKFIKMRHHAVLAFTHLRSKKIFHFLVEIFNSFKTSPLYFGKEVTNILTKRQKIKN